MSCCHIFVHTSLTLSITACIHYRERVGNEVSPMDNIIAPDPADKTAAHLESILMVLAGTCEAHMVTYNCMTGK